LANTVNTAVSPANAWANPSPCAEHLDASTADAAERTTTPARSTPPTRAPSSDATISNASPASAGAYVATYVPSPLSTSSDGGEAKRPFPSTTENTKASPPAVRRFPNRSFAVKSAVAFFPTTAASRPGPASVDAAASAAAGRATATYGDPRASPICASPPEPPESDTRTMTAPATVVT
jgi:hypothetical protein